MIPSPPPSPFGSWYATGQKTILTSTNCAVRVYTTDNCTINGDAYGIVAPSECVASDSGKPWLSYQVTLPDQ